VSFVDPLHHVDQPRLLESEMDPNPFRQFRAWYERALSASLPQPEGMTLATATPEGRPSARMVLLRGHDENGFVFFTNYDGRKGDELAANPRAALVFYWPELDRQIRIEGRVEKATPQESDAYWISRPRGSQLGAWASPQSEVIESREVLEERLRVAEARFGEGPVPRPPFWGGYRVVPDAIEFWQEGPSRLHDRLRYVRLPSGGWQLERLSP
jgi:pyridoxamine 5'-phosphate oxidase